MKKNIFKKSCSILFFVLCLSINQKVFADAKLPSLVAVCIDSVRVMNESTAVKEAQSQIEKKRSEYQKEIAEKENDLRQENEKLMAQQKTLSAKDFEVKQKKFEERVEKIKNFVETRRKQLELAYKQAIEQINKTFMGIAQKIAQEKGANAVFQREMLIWISESNMEITNDVIVALNKELPKVKVVFSSEKQVSESAPLSSQKAL